MGVTLVGTGNDIVLFPPVLSFMGNCGVPVPPVTLGVSLGVSFLIALRGMVAVDVEVESRSVSHMAYACLWLIFPHSTTCLQHYTSFSPNCFHPASEEENTVVYLCEDQRTEEALPLTMEAYAEDIPCSSGFPASEASVGIQFLLTFVSFLLLSLSSHYLGDISISNTSSWVPLLELSEL